VGIWSGINELSIESWVYSLNDYYEFKRNWLNLIIWIKLEKNIFK
jgi:hypothetical protein